MNTRNIQTAVVLVVHPAYLHFLKVTIASIDAQTLQFANKVLVYDMAYEPDAPDIQVPADWSVVVGNYRNPNIARNAALDYLGDAAWVCFWDADNHMPNTYLQASMRTIAKADNRVGVCYPHVQQVEPDGTFGYLHEMPPWSYGGAQFRSIADTSSFWKMQALLEVGGFKAGQFGHDDFALALSIFRAGWQGRCTNVLMNHHRHDGARSGAMEVTQSLWTAYSFAFVTLWSGHRETAERILIWLATAEIPPNSVLYWVDNSGGEMEPMLLGVFTSLLRFKFRALVYVDGGKPRVAKPGEDYKDLQRHSHVAHLYNLVLPRIREEIVVTLEDDTLPPHDGVRKLLENFCPGSNVALAAGVYRSRHNPAHICASLDMEKWKNSPKWDELPAHPFRVGMTGGGFAMIQNHALQLCLPMRCERTEDGRLMGWDGNLGLALTAHGFELLADPQVRCLHLCPEVVAFESGCPMPPRPYSPYSPYCYGPYEY